MQRSLHNTSRAGAHATPTTRPVCPHPSLSAPAHGTTAQRGSVRAHTAQLELAQAPCSQSQQYNLVMKDAMGWGDRPFSYDHSRGLYYHEVQRDVFCGSQPRHAQDIEELKELGITHILSLQEDKDMHHWGVNPGEISWKCQQLGIDLIRRPVQDFDPHSLRKVLPSAVQALNNAHHQGGRVYVHCTAGLGRAPGVIIAWLFWFHKQQLTLHEAYDMLTRVRPCGPKKEAIRGATFDLATGRPMHHLEHLPSDAFGGGLSQLERMAVQARVVHGHR